MYFGVSSNDWTKRLRKPVLPLLLGMSGSTGLGQFLWPRLFRSLSAVLCRWHGATKHCYSKVFGNGWTGKQASNPWLEDFRDQLQGVSWITTLRFPRQIREIRFWVQWKNVAMWSKRSYVETKRKRLLLMCNRYCSSPTKHRANGLSFGYGKTVGMKSEMPNRCNA